jgi:hypothetical protein
LFSRKDTLTGSKFIQQIWLETIMQHQDHVLSVFVGKSDLCCYCAAEGIQQDNDLKKKYWVVLPLCQACLRDKQSILKTKFYQKLTKHELDVA